MQALLLLNEQCFSQNPILDRHLALRRPTDEVMDERRHARHHALDAVGREARLSAHVEAGVDEAVRGALGAAATAVRIARAMLAASRPASMSCSRRSP